MSATDPFAAPERVHRPGDHAASTTPINPTAEQTSPEPPEAARTGVYHTESTAAENVDPAPAGETNPDAIAEARANDAGVVSTSAEAIQTGSLEASPAEDGESVRHTAGGTPENSDEGDDDPDGPVRRERGQTEADNNDEANGPDRNERGQTQADNTDEVDGPRRNERGQTEAFEGDDHASDANHDGPDAAGVFLDGTDHKPDVLRERAEGSGDDDDPYAGQTNEQLSDELERRGLAKSGTKPELLARLRQHDEENSSK